MQKIIDNPTTLIYLYESIADKHDIIQSMYQILQDIIQCNVKRFRNTAILQFVMQCAACTKWIYEVLFFINIETNQSHP